MLREQGRIVAVELDSVWVETIQKSVCASCVSQKGCGQHLLSKLGGKPNRIRVLLEDKDSKAYAVNQKITLGIPDDVVVKSSLLIYLLPLLLLIVFSGVAHIYGSSESLSITAGFIGLITGGLFIRCHADLSKNNPRLQPVLIDDQQGHEVVQKIH